MMIPQAIRMAEHAYQKYRTRDPYELMDARHILVKYFPRPEGLLGFYTVMNRKQIIGLNSAANDVQRRTGAIHELGHSLNDYRAASSGRYYDDFRFFSMSNAPSEANANLTGAHLFIPDDWLLERIRYGRYTEVTGYISRHIADYRSESARLAFEETQLQDFYDSVSDLPTYERLAAELGVDAGVVKFKFRALQYKGLELPNLPETRADFLKNWRHNSGC